MSETKLHFQLPENLNTEKLIAVLGEHLSLQAASRESSLKKFYDSFDWRLFCAGVLCEFVQSKSACELRLLNLQNGQILASENLHEVPLFADQFRDEAVRSKLASLLEMRALMPLASLKCQALHINVLDKEQKTTVRLLVKNYETLPAQVHIQAIRGYGKAAKRLSRLLEKELALKVVKKSLLECALEREGRQSNDYSSKLNIRLEPTTRADIACKYIYITMLRIIRANEAGTIGDVDSEFLHDLRVAIRRTRSGLSQLKNILPLQVTARYKAFFAWLGQITGAARDLDVYLLNFRDYKASLPVDMQNSLNPLYDFIQRKQIKAYQDLKAKLESSDYLSGLQAWQEYLNQSVAVNPPESEALQAIKQVADKRIFKVYHRVLKQAGAITESSPAEALHVVRKNCKKLRYLMEFFQSLYPEKEISGLIKALKHFQNILGNYQDYEVQEQTLKKFAVEMAEEQISVETFISMGVLVQNLQLKREQMRQNFAGSFAQFKQPANEAVFNALFASTG
ncbi:MAG: CHAD domain-containing protein [Gammaproteobacteria bacterium]